MDQNKTQPQTVAPLSKDELVAIANVLYNTPTQNLQAAEKLIELLRHVREIIQMEN